MSFNNEIQAVVATLLSNVKEELRSMSQEDLEQFWFYKHDPSNSPEWNLYQFQDMLNLYKRKCREWEEMHNGNSCVVERVRDKYLMPKIKEFSKLYNMKNS